MLRTTLCVWLVLGVPVAGAAPANLSPDPKGLLRAYEQTLVCYRQFKVRWTERNFELNECGEREWLNSSDQTLARDRDRQKYTARWKSSAGADHSDRNWEEDALIRGRSGISLHPPGPGSRTPVLVADLQVSDAEYMRAMRRGIFTGSIRGIWIPTFLKSSTLSARRETLDGRRVDVLRGVSGEDEIELWLDPALNHMPRKVSYRHRSSTPDSPSSEIVFEVKQFREQDGEFVPSEAVETQHTAARPAPGIVRAKVVDGKVVMECLPKKDADGKTVMLPASDGLSEVELVDIDFNPRFADEDFRFTRPVPDGTLVSVPMEPSIRHVRYEWRSGEVVKVVEPAIMGKFDPATDAKAEIADRLKASAWTRDRVLVIFGANAWPRCAALEQTFLSSSDTLLRLVDDVGAYGYQVVFADLTNRANQALAAGYGLTRDRGKSPSVAVLDADGRLLCARDLAAFERNDDYDADALDAFLKKWQASGENAEDALRITLDRAAKEEKKAFVIITGAHCVPCHRLMAFLTRWQDVLGRDYVFVNIDKDRMTHVAEVKAYVGFDTDRPATIPWYAILASTGESLVTSTGPAGNIGFPGTKPGVDHFVAMIGQTASHISAEQLRAIEEALVAANQSE